MKTLSLLLLISTAASADSSNAVSALWKAVHQKPQGSFSGTLVNEEAEPCVVELNQGAFDQNTVPNSFVAYLQVGSSSIGRTLEVSFELNADPADVKNETASQSSAVDSDKNTTLTVVSEKDMPRNLLNGIYLPGDLGGSHMAHTKQTITVVNDPKGNVLSIEIQEAVAGWFLVLPRTTDKTCKAP